MHQRTVGLDSTVHSIIPHSFNFPCQEQANRCVKASFANCPLSDRKLFSQSACILPISIMATKEFEERENRRFKATMQLVSASFKSCVLLVGDTLYRHTLRIDYPDEDELRLYQRAKKLGDLWIARHQGAYQQSTMPFKLKRWDDYLSHPKFSEEYAQVSKLYEVDQEYQKAMHANIEEYLKRYINQLGQMNFDYQQAFFACVAYLKEECAVMCLWAAEGYRFEVYPSGRCAAMAATYAQLIQPHYPTLLKPVGIRFKKRA